MNLAPRAFLNKVTIAVWGALGTVLMSAVGLIAALQFQSQRFPHFSPWQMTTFLAHIATPLQAVEFLLWAAITGALMALGFGASTVSRSRAAAAFAAGALVPLGLVSLGHLLNALWSTTTRPADAPLMTLLLALYSLTVPWVFGRLIVHWIPAYGVATETPKTISQ